MLDFQFKLFIYSGWPLKKEALHNISNDRLPPFDKIVDSTAFRRN